MVKKKKKVIDPSGDDYKKGGKLIDPSGDNRPAKKSGLSGAAARMKEKGTVGKFTARAGGKGKIGSQIKKDLKPGSKASGTAKKEANFAKMARRGWKPLGQKKKKA